MAVRNTSSNHEKTIFITERLKADYLLPNDDKEADRLDMSHEMILTLMDRKLFLAPIGQHPQRVIDIGTGTGIWAIDFGRKSTVIH
jgi:ubiquinone/menaquinone biosynthesis C-methylase UbiE